MPKRNKYSYRDARTTRILIRKEISADAFAIGKRMKDHKKYGENRIYISDKRFQMGCLSVERTIRPVKL